MNRQTCERITAGTTVEGHAVTTGTVCDTILLLANAPHRFHSRDIGGAIVRKLPNDKHTYQLMQEVLNRLMQRWRKMGLVTYDKGHWKLTNGAWDIFKNAVAVTQDDISAVTKRSDCPSDDA